MFKLKFKQKMKPNFLLCLTLRRKKAELDSTFLLFSVFTEISVPELAWNIDCDNYYNHQWSNYEF